MTNLGLSTAQNTLLKSGQPLGKVQTRFTKFVSKGPSPLGGRFGFQNYVSSPLYTYATNKTLFSQTQTLGFKTKSADCPILALSVFPSILMYRVGFAL